MYCSSCGAENAADNAFCLRCGARLGQPTPLAQQTVVVATPRRSSGIATAALIMGILSFPFGILFSILAIIFGNIGLGETRKDPSLEGAGMAKGGLVCGIISLALWVIGLIVYFAFIASLVATYS